MGVDIVEYVKSSRLRKQIIYMGDGEWGGGFFCAGEVGWWVFLFMGGFGFVGGEGWGWG